MSLLIQFKCLVFSFVCGFILLSIYHVINRMIWSFPFIIKLLIDFIMGFLFAFGFYKGLVFLNYGILYIYEFIFLFIGYYVNQKYYAYYELVILERIISFIKKIIRPFVFFLKKINVIIVARVRRVTKNGKKKNKV